MESRARRPSRPIRSEAAGEVERLQRELRRVMTERDRESFELSDRTYGSPHVWHDVRGLGEACGKNRVSRLMQLAKLQARRSQRHRRLT